MSIQAFEVRLENLDPGNITSQNLVEHTLGARFKQLVLITQLHCALQPTQ